MDNLINKLNKYLIQIIDKYAFPNFDKLISKIPKTRERIEYHLNPELTIEDIIIKCYHKGYQGFYINKEFEKLEIDFNLICNNSIKKNKNGNKITYHLFRDKRDLYVIDIFDLENVLIKNYKDYPY